MLRLLHILLFVFALNAAVSAQEKRAMRDLAWMDKVGVGGNVGLRFGDITYVEVSPIAGYRLTSFLMPGIGASYRYIRYRYYNFGNYENHVYGGSVWVRAYVAPMIFGYAEYEMINGEWDPLWQPGVRSFISTTFVGGGYSQEFAGSSSYVLVLFATGQDGDSIYWNPVIRVGFMVGGTAE